jgi:hypothetical protein
MRTKVVFINESAKGGATGSCTTDRSTIGGSIQSDNTLTTTQGIIKQEVDEGVEKMQAHVTAETIDQILQKELEVKEKVHDNKRDLQKFMVHWKKA